MTKHNQCFKVFDKKGNFVKDLNVGPCCTYKTLDQFETYLKEYKLYAQRLESFENRPYWKDWTFQQKLENLGWKFNKKGELINTEW